MDDIKYQDELVDEILKKKELSALDEDFIKKKIKDFFADIHNYQYKEKVLGKIQDSRSYSQFKKSKEYDYLIKGIRAELRKVYGAFILQEYAKKKIILERLKDDKDSQSIHEELLNLHKSTKERMGHYRILYDKIFEDITGKAVVMDIACGLNPVSNIYFRQKIKKYIASDISSEDCDFLKAYFDVVNIDNEVFPMDLSDEDNYKKLSSYKCDVCLIFKSLDGIERVKRNITRRLLQSIDTKYFAITFPTLPLSGHRDIKENRRLWLERLLDGLGWKWDKQLIENELLYRVKKT